MVHIIHRFVRMPRIRVTVISIISVPFHKVAAGSLALISLRLWSRLLDSASDIIMIPYSSATCVYWSACDHTSKRDQSTQQSFGVGVHHPPLSSHAFFSSACDISIVRDQFTQQYFYVNVAHSPPVRSHFRACSVYPR